MTPGSGTTENGSQFLLSKRMDSTRILVVGGVLLLLGGMLVGEIYAIFISHVTSHDILVHWDRLLEAVQQSDRAGVTSEHQKITTLLEQRGSIVSTHSQSIALGYLALSLALIQPLIRFRQSTKRWLAGLVLFGAFLFAGFTFASYYMGPWVHFVTDFALILLVAGLLGYLLGMFRSNNRWSRLQAHIRALLESRSSRILILGGLGLILVGMIFGLVYAGVYVYQYEPRQMNLLEQAVTSTMGQSIAAAQEAIRSYRGLITVSAIRATVHSHAIDFGTMAVLLAFVQNVILLEERWKRFWAWFFVFSAWVMPICIFTATLVGLVAAAFADLFGVFLMICLAVFLYGAVRYTGVRDANTLSRSEATTHPEGTSQP